MEQEHIKPEENQKAKEEVKVNKHIAFETKDEQVRRYDRTITRNEKR